MIQRDKFDEARVNLRDAQEVLISTIRGEGAEIGSEATMFDEAAFKAEISVIQLLRLWAEDQGIELAGEAFPEVRTIYNFILKRSTRLSTPTIRSNVGVISSWHSKYGMILGSGDEEKQIASPSVAAAEVIAASSRIFNYIDRHFVAE